MGGATEQRLGGAALPDLRRRGRWAQEQTLDRYLQESTVLLWQAEMPQLVRRLAALAPDALVDEARRLRRP